jgi:hypothetical protein
MSGESLTVPEKEQVALIEYVPDWALDPQDTGPLSPFEPVIVNGDLDVETGVLGAGAGCGVAPGMYVLVR